MLKVTVLLEAHDPMALARVAELEAERDKAKRDARNTPSPLFGAMADIAKVALTQAMSDPEKFKEFMKLFQNKRKPFDMSTLVSSLASGASGAAGNGADTEDDPDTSEVGDVVSSAAPSPVPALTPSKTPDAKMDMKIAETWTRLDPKSDSVFIRRSSSWPRPSPVVARVRRVGGDIPVELGAELHVWSLEANAKAGDLSQAPELTSFGVAARTAAGAAMAADKALRDTGWILLGDYDYNAFPGVDSDHDPINADDESDASEIRAHANDPARRESTPDNLSGAGKKLRKPHA